MAATTQVRILVTAVCCDRRCHGTAELIFYGKHLHSFASTLHISFEYPQHLLVLRNKIEYTFNRPFRTTPRMSLEKCVKGKFLSSVVFFFKITFFEIFFQEYNQSVKQIGSTSSPPLSGLIFVQTVCKAYQQTTLVDK